MIDDPHDNQARFRHTFSSPLTAMRGAIDLLRHRQRMGEDRTTRELLETLERNYIRVKHNIDILLGNVRIGNNLVEISAPLELFGIVDQPEITPPAIPETALAGTGERYAADLDQPAAQYMPDMIVVIAEASEQRKSVHATLQQAGYHVVSSNGGAEGIDLAREVHPEVIVIDYQLAHPGAAQVAKILRDDPDTKTIPLIFVANRPLTPEASLQQIELVPLNEGCEALVALVNKRIEAARASVNQAPTLLIVDDDADIQRIVLLRLQQDGYRVVQARNGAEALIAAQKQAFDMIILDLLLPDIDGFALAEQLRSTPATTSIPIVVLTGDDAALVRAQAMARFSDVLAKPCPADRLLQAIHQARRSG